MSKRNRKHENWFHSWLAKPANLTRLHDRLGDQTIDLVREAVAADCQNNPAVCPRCVLVREAA